MFRYILKKSKKIFNPILENCKSFGKINTWGAIKGKTEKGYANRFRESKEKILYKKYKYKSNIWYYSTGSKESKGHPASFPEKLANDHILSWSNPGDIILDPMCGSGTVLKAAKNNNRNSIGIEISKEYVEIAENRINSGFF